MTSHVVVDVGNSRIKWGLCTAKAVVATESLPDDTDIWTQHLTLWQRRYPKAPWPTPLKWAVAGVDPEKRDRFIAWACDRGDQAVLIGSYAHVPVDVDVKDPDQVGLDRLLNALAAKRSLLPGRPAVLIDAGTAITVDLLDEQWRFCGGAILPGLKIMARTLHDNTAQLPVVRIDEKASDVPGRDTESAIQVGIFAAVVGGVEWLTRRLTGICTSPPEVFLTGGDAALLLSLVKQRALVWPGSNPPVHWPEMTLEGIRWAAEALP